MAATQIISKQPVEISLGRVRLNGDLSLPERATGIIIFAHGSGSNRHSPRNESVAAVLQEMGFATLLLDLLNDQEKDSKVNVFNVLLLADRIRIAMNWAASHQQTIGLPIGLYGSNIGAAAAFVAAAKQPQSVKAIVARGGRPDRAYAFLRNVLAPTLLIVGGLDDSCINLNQGGYALLHCEKKLVIVPGATHLFHELGKLEEVAHLASEWFTRHLSSSGAQK